MIQTFENEKEIILNIDFDTNFSRKLVSPCLFVDTANKRIEVTWHMQHITPTGILYVTTTHKQVADNDVLVNLATQERMSIDEYQAMDPPPHVMGEYDFWHYANKNSPFPVMDQVEAFGNVFAKRNGWL
jgi:hypothetical protein